MRSIAVAMSITYFPGTIVYKPVSSIYRGELAEETILHFKRLSYFGPQGGLSYLGSIMLHSVLQLRHSSS
jgi:hypothetical protein